jgi:tellurite resistance protein TehA-like permease
MLVAAAPHSPVIEQILPFVRGLTLMWWATATWWIPMLLILGVWRHGVKKFPLRYDPLYWGAVFPLGMYTVCTARLSLAIDAGFLIAISNVFVYVALVAWSVTILGLVAQLVRSRSAPAAAT